MLKSDMQHQFWITKKTFQRKLGTKEDEHVISSDSELDSKIEIFKAIDYTSTELSKIIDLYQEKLCILSQEECVFSRFLKEAGKRSKTTCSSITDTGRGVAYSGQQRMCARIPLLRLQHEVEVFRCRAVRDTQSTIQFMEKERTEYRAALSWMKSASSELDPDTGKGLVKFRTAQSHVRIAKQNFDGLSLDSIQKIDLLAAARCNMYSHALVSYMMELKQFAKKSASTFQTISKSLLQKPKYDFYILKELAQNEIDPNSVTDIEPIPTIDKDQLLFFSDEFLDNKEETIYLQGKNVKTSENLTNPIQTVDLIQRKTGPSTQISPRVRNMAHIKNKPQIELLDHFEQNQMTSLNNENRLTGLMELNPLTARTNTDNNHLIQKSSKLSDWLELFADLDPLANAGHALQFDVGQNYQQT